MTWQTLWIASLVLFHGIVESVSQQPKTVTEHFQAEFRTIQQSIEEQGYKFPCDSQSGYREGVRLLTKAIQVGGYVETGFHTNPKLNVFYKLLAECHKTWALSGANKEEQEAFDAARKASKYAYQTLKIGLHTGHEPGDEYTLDNIDFGFAADRYIQSASAMKSQPETHLNDPHINPRLWVTQDAKYENYKLHRLARKGDFRGVVREVKKMDRGKAAVSLCQTDAQGFSIITLLACAGASHFLRTVAKKIEAVKSPLSIRYLDLAMEAKTVGCASDFVAGSKILVRRSNGDAQDFQEQIPTGVHLNGEQEWFTSHGRLSYGVIPGHSESGSTTRPGLYSGATPFQCAVINGHETAIATLLQLGTNHTSQLKEARVLAEAFDTLDALENALDGYNESQNRFSETVGGDELDHANNEGQNVAMPAGFDERISYSEVATILCSGFLLVLPLCMGMRAMYRALARKNEKWWGWVPSLLSFLWNLRLRKRAGQEKGGGGFTGDATMITCPITQEIFEDPVVAADGYTYERSAISEWLRRHDTSPMTNLTMRNKNLTPNHIIKSVVSELHMQNCSQ